MFVKQYYRTQSFIKQEELAIHNIEISAWHKIFSSKSRKLNILYGLCI